MSAGVDRMEVAPGGLERAALRDAVRAEVRAAHRRLTERQVELIADVAVELRLTRLRFGLPGTAS